MPQNPDAEFDSSVLDLIEQSTTGSVPRTPAYQDALNRLRASQQVYPDADHRDGYVTARSLATRPCFVANNLEAFVAATTDSAALESNQSIFTRYVASLPAALVNKAESVRLTVAGKASHHRVHGGLIARDPVHSLFLVPGTGRKPGIAGNYLYGALLQGGTASAPEGWAVHLHDSCQRRAGTRHFLADKNPPFLPSMFFS